MVFGFRMQSSHFFLKQANVVILCMGMLHCVTCEVSVHYQCFTKGAFQKASCTIASVCITVVSKKTCTHHTVVQAKRFPPLEMVEYQAIVAALYKVIECGLQFRQFKNYVFFYLSFFPNTEKWI